MTAEKKTRPGPWVAVSTKIADDKQFRRRAFNKFELVGLTVALTGRSADQKAEGVIDEDDLDHIALGDNADNVYAMVALLVEMGVLEDLGDGRWFLDGYSNWQVTEGELSEVRKRDAERKKAARERKKAEALAKAGIVSGRTTPDVRVDIADVRADNPECPGGQGQMSAQCPSTEEEEEVEGTPASQEGVDAPTPGDHIEAPFDGYAYVEHLLVTQYGKTKPMTQTKGRILKAVKGLLDDGVDADDIREGLRWWTWRHAVDGESPIVITTIVDDVRNGRTPAKPRLGATKGRSTAGSTIVAFDDTDEGDLGPEAAA